MGRTAGRLIALLLLTAAPLAAGDGVEAAAALVNKGRYAEAARAYESLVAADPENATLHYSLGLCYQSLKDYARAADSLDKAVSLAEDPSVPADPLALLHEALAEGADRPRRLALARDAWRIVVTRGRGEAARTAARHLETVEEELGDGR